MRLFLFLRSAHLDYIVLGVLVRVFVGFWEPRFGVILGREKGACSALVLESYFI